jgi:hypothetical protein
MIASVRAVRMRSGEYLFQREGFLLYSVLLRLARINTAAEIPPPINPGKASEIILRTISNLLPGRYGRVSIADTFPFCGVVWKSECIEFLLNIMVDIKDKTQKNCQYVSKRLQIIKMPFGCFNHQPKGILQFNLS